MSYLKVGYTICAALLLLTWIPSNPMYHDVTWSTRAAVVGLVTLHMVVLLAGFLMLSFVWRKRQPALGVGFGVLASAVAFVLLVNWLQGPPTRDFTEKVAATLLH